MPVLRNRDNVTDVGLLEFCIREDLNKKATRVMAVLDPVKVVLTNYPDGKEEMLSAENNPEDPAAGIHEIPFSREIYIEREDFREEAGSKFFRLSLEREVRLKNAYIIKGESVVKDGDGNITEIHCSCDLDSKSGSGTEASMRKVKGTLHWVSVKHAAKAEVRVYDRLFSDEAPDSHADKDFKEFLNPDSLNIIKEAYAEPFLKEAKMHDKFQFQRLGYFTLDKDSDSENLVFNKTVGLRDSWAKQKPESKQSSETEKPQPKDGGKRNPMVEINKLGKKLANFSGDKYDAAKKKIEELAGEILYEELEPLFSTAAKKKGTRIATMISLRVLLKKGQERNEAIDSFINAGLNDDSEMLRKEASSISS